MQGFPGGFFETTAADAWADEAYAAAMERYDRTMLESDRGRAGDPDVDAFEAMQEDRRTTTIQRQLEDSADLAGADTVDIKGESDGDRRGQKI